MATDIQEPSPRNTHVQISVFRVVDVLTTTGATGSHDQLTTRGESGARKRALRE